MISWIIKKSINREKNRQQFSFQDLKYDICGGFDCWLNKRKKFAGLILDDFQLLKEIIGGSFDNELISDIEPIKYEIC